MLRRFLIVSLVLGTLLPGSPAPAAGTSSRIAVRVATGAPQVGAPLVLSGTVRPKGVRRVALQRKTAGRWTTVARGRSDRRGRYRLRLRPVTAERHVLRVRAAASSKGRSTTSKVVRVPVADQPCRPGPGPVDPAADAATAALLAGLDEWRCAGRMAVGQQVNISNDEWAQVLDVAPARFRVVGFDLTELADALALGKTERIDRLIELARAGHVLTASWHARNPWTGGDAFDRTGAELGDLLTPGNAAYDAFWATWQQHLATLAQLAAAGVPVVVRPLHEASGGWFWWGHPDPAEYRALFARLQSTAEAAGVHNLLWAYAAAPQVWSGIQDPLALVPARVDLGGTDSYDDTADGGPARVDLTSYPEVGARVRRTALTEVGPQHSNGAWDPAVVTETLRRTGTNALWAMFWFDDGQGLKAVRSLQGGAAWLGSCPDGFCPVPGGVG
jgi:hypothetical protein